MIARINYRAEDTWLEPYIEWEFIVVKRGARKSLVEWFGSVKKLENKLLDFDLQ